MGTTLPAAASDAAAAALQGFAPPLVSALRILMDAGDPASCTGFDRLLVVPCIRTLLTLRLLSEAARMLSESATPVTMTRTVVLSVATIRLFS